MRLSGSCSGHCSVGARAVIAPGRIHVDLRRFIQLIIEYEIVALHFVPAMLQTFLSADEASACTSLRYIIASGEPISMNLLERFQARMDAQLVNFYGVTEVSIDSTSYTCPPVQEIDFVRSGVPNYNTQIYVLDAWMQPLPNRSAQLEYGSWLILTPSEDGFKVTGLGHRRS